MNSLQGLGLERETFPFSVSSITSGSCEPLGILTTRGDLEAGENVPFGDKTTRYHRVTVSLHHLHLPG